MRVLVTGASGFVAKHLVPSLARSHDVFALTHDAGRAPEAAGVETLIVDLRQLDDASLPNVDAIVHLAQANVPFPDGARDLFAVNTASTLALLEHGRSCGAARFVFASTASVYGFGDRPWTEEDPTAATDFYSATKLAGERLVRAYDGFLGTTIMRLVAPYGPGQRNRMIPRLIESVHEGRAITLNEGGRPRMNPIFVGDVVRLVEASLESDGSQLVNVAGDEAASIRELAEAIGRVVGREPVFEPGQNAAPGDIVCANERMRAAFAIGELTPLAEGLARASEVPAGT
jgi:nucleoside-diphosphate-sugar epimerase